LRANPFSLPFDRLIKAKVKAFNINGWSDYSDLNTAGAKI
jgi:hypothetical protein